MEFSAAQIAQIISGTIDGNAETSSLGANTFTQQPPLSGTNPALPCFFFSSSWEADVLIARFYAACSALSAAVACVAMSYLLHNWTF